MRWIFLSHDDVDHTGNLDEAMTACPNAQLVCNWAMVERHTNCFDFPLERCRWVMHGETFDVGDRTLHALRPPVFDSPTTRGLFDPTTGVYWAVDTFATPLPDPQHGRSPTSTRSSGTTACTLFALGAVSPWLTMLDPTSTASYVDRVQNLDITTIASVSQPGDRGPVHRAGVRPRSASCRRSTAPTLPDQSILDQIVSATSIPQS